MGKVGINLSRTLMVFALSGLPGGEWHSATLVPPPSSPPLLWEVEILESDSPLAVEGAKAADATTSTNRGPGAPRPHKPRGPRTRPDTRDPRKRDSTPR